MNPLKAIEPVETVIIEDVVARMLRADMKAAASELGDNEARYLVDAYYAMQKVRIHLGNQTSAAGRSNEPNRLTAYLQVQMAILEGTVKSVLDQYTQKSRVGKWMRGITGIGPVLAAGLLSQIDITRAPTVGHIWSFAGLDPSKKWLKGQKRPWNARLRVICWKIGESFVKVSALDSDVYGKHWIKFKARYAAKNEAGDYAGQAADILASKNFGKDTLAYAAYIKGKLPLGHVHARAKRAAVKLFLAHLHDVWYRDHYGKAPPFPYIFEHSGAEHVHYIPPPEG
ncbi:MAG: transposase [Patescibacteria group bacterium]